MGLDDKIKNKLDKVTGAGKEKLGEARGDRKQEAEGKADQSKADLKQSGEHIKDAGSDAKDSFKR
ncbi:CsbD family protein [Aeromicrobium sp.]|uniref:CsbD family protein n=1 Tax=Aeromicrobium sp. TaxID=1871063 RepID=UPI003D6C0CDC